MMVRRKKVSTAVPSTDREEGQSHVLLSYSRNIFSARIIKYVEHKNWSLNINIECTLLKYT